jgi:hypothetical protein
MLFITAYSRLCKQTLSVNGESVFTAGDMLSSQFTEAAYAALRMDYPKFYKMDVLSQCGMLCAELLMKSRPLGTYHPENIAIVLSNSSSSLDTDRKYFDSSRTVASPGLFVYTLPNIVGGEISIRYRAKGENAFLVSEQFNAALLCEYAEMVFADSNTEAMIAGWVEVIGEHRDVLLYLVERTNAGMSEEHSPQTIEKLYQ